MLEFTTPLRISEITNLIKTTLEQSFYGLTLIGEVSNFRPSSSGHWYITLKDEHAAISAVMFKNVITRSSYVPKDGDKVIVTGNLSVYAQRGNYQIICSTLKPAGSGDLQQLLELRKRKLSAEGLFDLEHKKPLPKYPKKIGVITSQTGAALRDILQVLSRRASGIDVLILPAAVQGNKSAQEIISQIERANRFHLAEVLIIGRGGGSMEDLLPFSEESVVRAVFNSEIPIISAVGHEIDWALIDYAADLRAPTPSAAAELVCKDTTETLYRIKQVQKSITDTMTHNLSLYRNRLGSEPLELLEEKWHKTFDPFVLRVDDSYEQLQLFMQNLLKQMKQRVTLSSNVLKAYSPEDILSKGYAIVLDEATGRVIKAATELQTDAEVRIQLSTGSFRASVKEIIE